MSLKTSDLIIYPSRCETADVVAGLLRVLGSVPNHAEEFLAELAACCRRSGVDFAFAASHTANETNFYRDDLFQTRRNPAGIGVTGEPGVLGPLFPSYAAAALFYVAEVLLKTKRPLGDFRDARQFAPGKYDGVTVLIADPTFPRVERIGDLNRRFGANNRECVWMCDESGPEAVAGKAAALIPAVPDQTAGGINPAPPLNMTKGLIPLPPHVEDFIDVSVRDQSRACRGYDDLGDRPNTPRFLVLHKSQCEPFASNAGFFRERCCPALTDWEVVATTGQMRRFVGRGGDEPAGWANGVVSNPYGDALKWLNLHGWDLDTVNRDGEAIEITGWFPVPGEVDQDTAVSEAALQNIAQWIASRAHDYGITYETFPMIPVEDGRSYVTWHQEWTIGTGKTCPGPWVMNRTEDILARARAIMADAQTGAGPQPPQEPVPLPAFARPDVPDWLTADLQQGYPSDHVWKGVQIYGALREYTVRKPAKRLQLASKTAKEVGPPLKTGEQFLGWYVFRSGRRWWVMTPFGSRIDMGALTPRVRFALPV